MLQNPELGYQNAAIQKDFLQLDSLKQDFDTQVAGFKKTMGEAKELTLGQFFNWLWDKNCASYNASDC